METFSPVRPRTRRGISPSGAAARTSCQKSRQNADASDKARNARRVRLNLCCSVMESAPYFLLFLYTHLGGFALHETISRAMYEIACLKALVLKVFSDCTAVTKSLPERLDEIIELSKSLLQSRWKVACLRCFCILLRP